MAPIHFELHGPGKGGWILQRLAHWQVAITLSNKPFGISNTGWIHYGLNKVEGPIRVEDSFNYLITYRLPTLRFL
jgi:hypothetical protein